MIREAREDVDPEHVIRRSAEILVRHVRAHPRHFGFIARERQSGMPALRQAIRSEIRLFASELATDLARFPQLAHWSTEDLRVLAGLLVSTMVATIESILDSPPDSPEAEEEVTRIARKQMTMIVIGTPSWQSDRE
jgi:hypothetical protein